MATKNAYKCTLMRLAEKYPIGDPFPQHQMIYISRTFCGILGILHFLPHPQRLKFRKSIRHFGDDMALIKPTEPLRKRGPKSSQKQVQFDAS